MEKVRQLLKELSFNQGILYYTGTKSLQRNQVRKIIVGVKIDARVHHKESP